jgi:hypothetical protein
MRQRRQTGTEHIDAPHRCPVGKSYEQRDRDHISGKENADQSAGFGFDKSPRAT